MEIIINLKIIRNLKKFHNFDIGIKNFVNWYKEFYKIKNE